MHLGGAAAAVAGRPPGVRAVGPYGHACAKGGRCAKAAQPPGGRLEAGGSAVPVPTVSLLGCCAHQVVQRAVRDAGCGVDPRGRHSLLAGSCAWAGRAHRPGRVRGMDPNGGCGGVVAGRPAGQHACMQTGGRGSTRASGQGRHGRWDQRRCGHGGWDQRRCGHRKWDQRRGGHNGGRDGGCAHPATRCRCLAAPRCWPAAQSAAPVGGCRGGGAAQCRGRGGACSLHSCLHRAGVLSAGPAWHSLDSPAALLPVRLMRGASWRTRWAPRAASLTSSRTSRGGWLALLSCRHGAQSRPAFDGQPPRLCAPRAGPRGGRRASIVSVDEAAPAAPHPLPPSAGAGCPPPSPSASQALAKPSALASPPRRLSR